ncbi:hypothetical protein J6590_032328 [Homalodisca vitripennis]|nr:hypothetical protein J6590_032328 [Homalodisca vitripennis]
MLNRVQGAVPRGTCSKSVFSRHFQPINYTQNQGKSRLLRTGEATSSSVNFFGNSSFLMDAIGFLRDWKRFWYVTVKHEFRGPGEGFVTPNERKLTSSNSVVQPTKHVQDSLNPTA